MKYPLYQTTVKRGLIAYKKDSITQSSFQCLQRVWRYSPLAQRVYSLKVNRHLTPGNNTSFLQMHFEQIT